MGLNAKQSLDYQVFELGNYILIIDTLFFIGCPQHLEVPFGGILVELLLILIITRNISRRCILLSVFHLVQSFVSILYESSVLLIDREVC